MTAQKGHLNYYGRKNGELLVSLKYAVADEKSCRGETTNLEFNRVWDGNTTRFTNRSHIFFCSSMAAVIVITLLTILTVWTDDLWITSHQSHNKYLFRRLWRSRPSLAVEPRRKTEILRKEHLDMLCCAKQMHFIIIPEQTDTPCKKFQMKYGMIHISKTFHSHTKAWGSLKSQYYSPLPFGSWDMRSSIGAFKLHFWPAIAPIE